MTGFVRNTGLLCAAVAAIGLCTPVKSHADTWPSRPVTIVVPFTAGTTSDVLARGLAQALNQELGQPFLIDNRGGAGGNIGATHLAHSPPDVARQSGWEHSDNQDGHFGGRGERIFVAARR